MLFHSYEFLFLFLPAVLFGCFWLAKRRRGVTVWLAVMSLLFYADWDARYLPLLMASILFNYQMGRCLERSRRKCVLTAGIIVNFLLLGWFKYAGFFAASFNAAFAARLPVPELVLPLGISFFTFTQTAYLVDAYRGETQGYSLPTYGLFVTIFPHLIAGPILYHKDMIPQLSRLRSFAFDWRNLTLGTAMFTIGLFKKVVIADTLAPWVNLAFDHAEQLSFIEAWGGALAYTLQLYFDFSGYSEMALGLGLLLNLRLPLNFNSPYRATSVIDFWRRWHMTLSVFLKNYLYIPLGGSRRGEWTKLRNLLLTMLLGGLWHGAGWTFVVWGGLHGVFLVVNHQWRRAGIRLPGWLNWGLTFGCVVVAWVFFRAHSVGDAWAILQAMGDIRRIVLPAGGAYEAKLGFLQSCGVTFANGADYALFPVLTKLLFVCAFLLVWVVGAKNTQEQLASFRPNWRWAAGLGILLGIAVAGLNRVTEFLYFQF